MPRAIKAFLSYARELNENDVERLRSALEGSVREYGWKDFLIFHDRRDIAWGDDWRKRIH